MNTAMKVLLLVGCLTSAIWQSHGQTGKSKIDKKDLRTFVKILSSDSLEGRGTGSEGQRRAERFISDRFKQLGLETYHQNSYLERFTLSQTYWAQVYIKVQTRILENFEDIVFQGNVPQNEEVEMEVVFGGRGTEEELNQIEVRDRLVLVFVRNLRGSYEINRRLAKREAAGVILANPENEQQFKNIRNTLKDYTLQKRLSLPESDIARSVSAKWDTIGFINTITIPNSEIKHVIGFPQRHLITLIDENRIKDLPISKVSAKFQRIQNDIETANVVGVIKGSSSKTIIISAHYDHLGRSGKRFFPGADDNASGTAALLELAEEFSGAKYLEYNILFLATSAEEAGLLGARYHVNQERFNTEDILCNLNLDMIARSDDKHDDGAYLYCIGTDQSIEMDHLIRKADILFDKISFDYSLNNSTDPAGLFTRSDNYIFYKKGIPALHFYSGLHSDYHKATDTADKIDFANLESRVKQISVVIELLQREGLKN